MSFLNTALHVVARVAIRFQPPVQAKRLVDALGRLTPPLRDSVAAKEMASSFGTAGTCLSRSLAVAARTPGAEVVIGGDMFPEFWAHAWVERAGVPLSRVDVNGAMPQILARLK